MLASLSCRSSMEYITFVMRWLSNHYSIDKMRCNFDFVNSTLEEINTTYMNYKGGDVSYYVKMYKLIQLYETERAIENLD